MPVPIRYLTGRPTPPRIVANKPQSITCPTCGAGIGEACIYSSGNRGRAHISRQRLAARARNEAL